MSCQFCEIISGKKWGFVIMKEKTHIVILDINPATEGHSLIIPLEHYENLESLPEEVFSEMTKTAKNLSKILKIATSATGINIILNDGKDAGQRVFHLHLHVIPRYPDDGHNFILKRGIKRPGMFKEVMEKIKKVIEQF